LHLSRYGGDPFRGSLFGKEPQAQPIGRMGKRDEIANPGLYLASAEAGFVNGSVYTIDGGWTAA